MQVHDFIGIVWNCGSHIVVGVWETPLDNRDIHFERSKPTSQAFGSHYTEEEFILRKLDDHIDKCDLLENSADTNELSVEFGINR